jgi:hypothetical protein
MLRVVCVIRFRLWLTRRGEPDSRTFEDRGHRPQPQKQTSATERDDFLSPPANCELRFGRDLL